MVTIVDDIAVKVLDMQEDIRSLREIVSELVDLIENVESSLPSGLVDWISPREYENLLARAKVA
ncbi:hypothetical protein [Providencia phage PSTCR6]|nr:hypothetical protein [Providencia phage PSTCR6]